MKIAIVQLLTIVISIYLLSGCTNGKNNDFKIAKVSPAKIEINGDLSEYLQVVNGDYEIVDDFGGKLSIKVKAIKALPESELNNDIKIYASILGENGVPISGTGVFEMLKSSKEKVIFLLKRGSGEEVIELESDTTQYKGAKNGSRAKTFVVSSLLSKTNDSGNYNTSFDNENTGIYYAAIDKVFFYNTPDFTSKRKAYLIKGTDEIIITKIENGFGYTVFTSTKNLTTKGWLQMSELTQEYALVNTLGSDNNVSQSKDESITDIQYSSTDCDKFMKDYEAFVNNYIKLIKKYKANPTDGTILNEYTEALQNASTMANNVSLCSATKYATKLLELQNKLAKVSL